MLLHGDALFLQVLEGEASALDALYENILADPRHHGCHVVWRKVIPQREFGDWSMASASVEPGRFSDLPGFSAFMGAERPDLPAEFAGAAHFMLRSFRDLHGSGK